MKQQTAKLRPPEQTATGSRFGDWFAKNKLSIIILLIAAFLFAGVNLYIRADDKPVYQAGNYDSYYYEKAEILNISRDTISPDEYAVDDVEIGSQLMLVRIKSGMFAGENMEVTNNVSTFFGRKMSVGDSIILCIYTEYTAPDKTYEGENATVAAEDGGLYSLESASVYAPERTLAIIALLVLFIAITTLVGGRTGLKSLLGLAITVICLIWIMCPLLMKGAPVILTAFLICVFVTVVCFVILGGVSKKTVCAILGTVAGVALAALFGEIAQALCKVNSYNLYDINGEIEEFKNIQLQGIPLHITGLMTAGILISALGAVMDVAMSLSSAMSELKSVNPSLGFKELWKSGMNIGRDMVGTMTNTLILAFVGSSLVIVIWMWSLNLSFHQLVSSPFLSLELISALSSSVGVILAVPLTALIGAAFYGKKSE